MVIGKDVALKKEFHIVELLWGEREQLIWRYKVIGEALCPIFKGIRGGVAASSEGGCGGVAIEDVISGRVAKHYPLWERISCVARDVVIWCHEHGAIKGDCFSTEHEGVLTDNLFLGNTSHDSPIAQRREDRDIE